MNVYDIDLIMSWTPKYFKWLVKGAQLAETDKIESLAIAAIFNAKANNSKRISLKKLYDADKARRKIEHGEEVLQEEIERSMQLNKAFKGFDPNSQFRKKGG